jgi:hypothetical protein
MDVELNFVERQVKKLKSKNKKLKHMLLLQSEQIERNRLVTETLLNGLFDPNQQSCEFGRNLTILNGKAPYWYQESQCTAADWQRRFPTTVQGDNNAARIMKLEDQIEGLTENMEERDQKLTEIEDRLTEMEAQLAAMEKNQLERLGLSA